MNQECLNDGVALGVTSALAYVGMGGSSIAERFDLTGETWVRPDNVVLWEKASDLASRTPLAPLGVLANGTYQDIQIWGGANKSDSLANTNGADNCNDWTTTNGTGFVGRSISNGRDHLHAFTGNCDEPRPIYCFED